MLTGTVRAVEPVSRALMLDEVRAIATAVASGYGVTARVTLDMGTPPIVNPARTDRMGPSSGRVRRRDTTTSFR